MTYMFILKCALKLVLKNILYYDARLEKHQNTKNKLCIKLVFLYTINWPVFVSNLNSAPSTII